MSRWCAPRTMAVLNLTAQAHAENASVRRVLFLCEPAYRWYLDGVIEAITSQDGYEVIVESSEGLDHLESGGDRFDLIVTIHSSVDRVLRFCAARRGRVPSLTIQDGIIEYRSSNHRVQGHLRYRPLCTDFIAVFGPRSRSLVEAYGTSPERIFVTGSPRFDRYFDVLDDLTAEACLLITMANRSSYGRERMVRFYRLLIALLRYCEQQCLPYRLRLGRGAKMNGIESIEKVAPDLSDEEIQYFRSRPVSERCLMDDLRAATAVVTTPSTVSLEAMSLGRPVAHLNFDAETVFLQSAWVLSSAEDFSSVIPQLLNPSSYKMAFQRVILNENIVGGASATEAVVNLVLRLAATSGSREIN